MRKQGETGGEVRETHYQPKKKIKNRRKRIFVLLFFGILFAGILFCYYYTADKETEKKFRQLEETEEERERHTALPDSPDKKKNPDWIGWLKIRGTTVSYPVMQRDGAEEYYLHRDFDGNYSFYGTPFLDFRCSWDSDNAIVYGHNINGGRMFGALHAFDSRDFYVEHKEIELRAGEKSRTYQVLAVIHTDTSSPLYYFTETGNWEEYRDYVKTMIAGSLYRTELAGTVEKKMAEKNEEDFFRSYQFLTLSTCRTSAGRDKRLMIVAAKERTKED